MAIAAAAVAGGLAIPATGSAAVAAIQDDHLTDAAPLTELPKRIAAVKATRAKVARFDILWSKVAPTKPRNARNHRDPAYDWKRADAVINGFTKAKITPIISVYSTPDWAVAGRNLAHETAYNPNAPRAKMYGDFLYAVSQRYKGKARHYEIWNEPNLRGFFQHNGRSNVSVYKGLVRVGYTQLKRSNRRNIVIAGVAGPNNSNKNGNVAARNWLNSLTRDRKVNFDAYSQHIYPSQAPRFTSRSYAKAFPTWNSLPEIFRALDRKKKGMKLYVTEAGYTTAGTEFRDARTAITPARQANYLRQIYTLPKLRTTRLAAVVWFNLEDNKNWPAGLLYEGGRKKPSYNAFRKMAARPIPAALRAELRPR